MVDFAGPVTIHLYYFVPFADEFCKLFTVAIYNNNIASNINRLMVILMYSMLHYFLDKASVCLGLIFNLYDYNV